ncbi:helix-turn-helix transcriptional regulator [Rhodocytophaga rosea]|uniref:Helix-turn-helix transcriptional regulator n=1 Tax=Rhodocytophaga rosea TaxID=2704465 RepID=A0A6C0GSX9_9BACT|nr:AraC family transcriptional regulator [Rhodocytophaga rosea]QHT70653.1 helix-turn-helix transcriptional regulator [Rhodocytophaga rosea]
MAIEIQDIADINSQLANKFFLAESNNQNLIEHTQTLALPFGNLFSKEWYFDGIRMGYSDWVFSRPIDMRWHYDIKVDLVTFQLNLHGALIIEDKETHASFLLPDHHHNLFYSNPGVNSSGLLKNNNGRVSLFMVQFTKDNFLSLTQGANEALDRFSESVMVGKPAVLSPRNLPLEASFKNVMHNILNCGYTAGIKKMYLLSKTIEFLVLQAEACNAALIPAYKSLKSAYDKECMVYAKEYLLKNLEVPPSISQLSKIVGINEYKLKRGFKEMFNNTVFGYVAEARLEIAKNDLLETDKKVIEIASDLGYSSLQHFSHAFKKKFGFSPNTLRK